MNPLSRLSCPDSAGEADDILTARKLLPVRPGRGGRDRDRLALVDLSGELVGERRSPALKTEVVEDERKSVRGERRGRIHHLKVQMRPS